MNQWAIETKQAFRISREKNRNIFNAWLGFLYAVVDVGVGIEDLSNCNLPQFNKYNFMS